MYKGPPLSDGLLPAVIYFALSAEESLSLDPYNQPIVLLKNKPVRIFSFTLPFHGPQCDNKEVMKHWAKELEAGHNFISPFIQEIKNEINQLIDEGIIDLDRLAVMGLSRGAFVASHLAAAMPCIQTVLGFAPLVSLQPLSLETIAPALVGKNLRFYIGNRDTRVGTAKCFSFIHHLTELSWHAGHRSPPVELILYPSFGYKGHGTSPQIFEDGIKWLINKLNV